MLYETSSISSDSLFQLGFQFFRFKFVALRVKLGEETLGDAANCEDLKLTVLTHGMG